MRMSGAVDTPKEPRIWGVGERIGAAIRKHTGEQTRAVEAAEGQGHASPRPHVRRAHWHHFWRGAKARPEARELVLRWLPPIPMGAALEDDGAPVVVHPVMA